MGLVLSDQLPALGLRVGCLLDLLAEDDVDRSLRAHHGDLRGGPGEGHVCPEVLGVHDHVGTTVGLARDHGHLGHGGLGEGVQQLGPSADDPPVLLRRPRKEPRHVLEHHQRDVEGVAEPDEARRLLGGLVVERSGEDLRLVGHDPDRAAVQAREADQDVGRPQREDLEELALVHHPPDHVLHVVGCPRRVGDDRVEGLVAPVRIVTGCIGGRVLQVVRGQERQQVTDLGQAVGLVVGDEAGDAGTAGVRVGTSQLLEGDVLARHRADHVGSGDEHVRGALHHEHEVGDGGGVDGAAGAGAHDQRDLGHHPAGPDVAVEDVTVAGEGGGSLLDPGSAGIVDADDRRADRHGQVHDLADLLGHDLTERAAEHGEVLAEHEHLAAVDGSPAGDDAVGVGPGAIQAEGAQAVAGQHVRLHERPRVEKQLEPLSGSQLPPGVLPFDGVGAATEAGLLLEFAELLDALVDGSAMRGRFPLGRLGGVGATLQPNRAVCVRYRLGLGGVLGVGLAGLFALFSGLCHGDSAGVYPSEKGADRRRRPRSVGGRPYHPGRWSSRPLRSERSTSW